MNRFQMAEQPKFFSFSLYARSKQKHREHPGSCSKSHRRRSISSGNPQRRPHPLATQSNLKNIIPRKNPQPETGIQRQPARIPNPKNQRLCNNSQRHQYLKPNLQL